MQLTRNFSSSSVSRCLVFAITSTVLGPTRDFTLGSSSRQDAFSEELFFNGFPARMYSYNSNKSINFGATEHSYVEKFSDNFLELYGKYHSLTLTSSWNIDSFPGIIKFGGQDHFKTETELDNIEILPKIIRLDETDHFQLQTELDTADSLSGFLRLDGTDNSQLQTELENVDSLSGFIGIGDTDHFQRETDSDDTNTYSISFKVATEDQSQAQFYSEYMKLPKASNNLVRTVNTPLSTESPSPNSSQILNDLGDSSEFQANIHASGANKFKSSVEEHGNKSYQRDIAEEKFLSEESLTNNILLKIQRNIHHEMAEHNLTSVLRRLVL